MTKKRTKAGSFAQQTQRELAWLLYISEGYRANLEHALTVNAYTLDDTTLGMMAELHASAEEACKEIRFRMGMIAQEI